ncbi:hypothetical protein BKA66DRAFT_409366 [Pyrenochaeta sp. MPI-SDFR-AT-0127]|nr:hypothetical protein BKA66DRAFT_409366 [Pyrenochaeta sp. MPI-SDFR-AT-0127]
MPKTKRKVVSKSKRPIKDKASSLKLKATKKTKSNNSIRVNKEAVAANEPPLFFWKESETEGGFLSPWYKSRFRVDGVMYESVGHAIMAEKARIFGGKEVLQLIIAAKSAEQQKIWGNNVKNFDEKRWQEEALMIATRANMSKFSYSTKPPNLQKQLLSIGEREIVLASPSDRLFGIGFGAAEAKTTSQDQWGQNLFGKSLDAVRRSIQQLNDPNFPAAFDKPGGKMNVYW